jgi:hypothetical protein
MITRLNPPLPLETSKGAGWAHFVIDYGPESALLWVVFMDQDGRLLDRAEPGSPHVLQLDAGTTQARSCGRAAAAGGDGFAVAEHAGTGPQRHDVA